MKLLTALRTKPLLEAMKLYVRILKLFFTMEDFQYKDWLFVEKHNKCCCIRSRGGSKTQDFTNWLIFHVLRTNEQWIWMACKGGQLQQALMYVRQNPFVKKVRRETAAKYDIYLLNGKMIRFGIISTSNLGLRVDGIVYDEFEDLKPMQEMEIYPQMAGMMTHSKIHKTLYLGTLWINAKLNEFSEIYPTEIRPWDTIKWLVDAGMIQAEIDEGKTPEWEIDMLYRCIPTAPSGLLFPQVEVGSIKYDKSEVQYGIDFGSKDTCVGVVIRDNICYIVEEYEFELELRESAYDFLSEGKSTECEGGGYNDSEKYGEKSKLIIRRVLRAIKKACSNKWKAIRQRLGRAFDKIIIDKRNCPKTYNDVKSATFGPDGLYFKHPTKAPCHNLDAFFHAIHKYIGTIAMNKITTNLDANYVGNNEFGTI